ncbi:MAG TPA: DUF362 domain-containing protein [Anaerolineae bacterium]|nr:DUF362 domain-containing protein [Anaerolineae bacterium]HOQ99032.1 DUF362 domain-containing protein [Anaerolineae bacterium]HPL29257.1 DUF362 domain-containing protein [Anaerolineae bacterium]
MSTVAITRDTEFIGQAIFDALNALDLEDLFTNRLVAIKPNDTAATPDDISGVTHADSLQAVIRFVKGFNPRHIVVSGGAGASITEDVFNYTGMMEVIRREGVEFFDHNQGPFEEVTLASGPQRQVMINPRILEYDSVVSLAQLKLHETATVTLSMKNVAMSFPAADYYGHPRASGERHENDFFGDMQEFIVAMVKRFPPSLAVIVGHPAMVGTGPLGGIPVETGLVIASRDFVAADAAGAELFGFNMQGVRHIFEAYRAGLGEGRTSSMTFPLMSLSDAIGAFTRVVYTQEAVWA